MSALGIYPMNPVNGQYVFGSPVIDKAVIKLENGRQFTIVAKNNTAKNIYISSVELNGRKYNGISLDYNKIIMGGKLEFVMNSNPGKHK